MAKTKLQKIKCVVTVKVPENHTYTENDMLDAIRIKANLPEVKFYSIEPLNDES